MPLGVLFENTEQVLYCKLKTSEAEGRNTERFNHQSYIEVQGGPFSKANQFGIGIWGCSTENSEDLFTEINPKNQRVRITQYLVLGSGAE